MNKDEYLRKVRKQIHYILDRDSIEIELKHHIEESMYDLMDEGYSSEEAERMAVEQMGDPIIVGKQLNKEHHPVLGYAYLISKVILIVVGIFSLNYILSFGKSIIDFITPTVVDNSVKTVKLNIKRELPTHTLIIDNICLDKNGDYYITYRQIRNYEYSRVNWSIDLFNIEDVEGNRLRNKSYSSNSLLGEVGSIGFEWNENNVIVIKIINDEKIGLNYEEYFNEEN